MKILRLQPIFSPRNLITLELIFVLSEQFLIQVCGFPGAIIYILDVANLVLLLCLWHRKSCKIFVGMAIPYAIMVFLSLFVGVINFNEWGGNLVTSAIEIRNIVRFFVFFVACVTFLDEKKCKEIYRILTTFFFANAVAILYQYVTFHPAGVWMRGDMLNGFFGTRTGGNTFVNVVMLVAVTYVLIQWSNGKLSSRTLFITIGVSIFIAGLIELKAFFLEFVLIYGLYFIGKRKTRKEIYLSVGILALFVCVGGVALQIMFREYPWFRETMSISGMINSLKGNGYTGEGDLNRFTGIFTIASNFFNQDISKIIFGIGAGNCSASSVMGSAPLFYEQHMNSHYNWFSATYLFVQGGAIGLLLYLFTFVYLFFRKKRNRTFALNAKIICVLAVFLAFYGEALKTDAGYFVYFAIASGFVRPNKMEAGRKWI